MATALVGYPREPFPLPLRFWIRPRPNISAETTKFHGWRCGLGLLDTLPTCPLHRPTFFRAGCLVGRGCGGVAQLVRVSACHAEGRGFEPRRSRHFTWRSSVKRLSFGVESCSKARVASAEAVTILRREIGPGKDLARREKTASLRPGFTMAAG